MAPHGSSFKTETRKPNPPDLSVAALPCPAPSPPAWRHMWWCCYCSVVLHGYCQGKGYRVGFGSCSGKILPAGTEVRARLPSILLPTPHLKGWTEKDDLFTRSFGFAAPRLWSGAFASGAPRGGPLHVVDSLHGLEALWLLAVFSHLAGEDRLGREEGGLHVCHREHPPWRPALRQVKRDGIQRQGHSGLVQLADPLCDGLSSVYPVMPASILTSKYLPWSSWIQLLDRWVWRKS